LATIRSAYEEFYHNASNPSWWRSILESGEWKRYAIYAVEAYGIFTIGEMIGRRWVIFDLEERERESFPHL
jgi:F-type H+-transporting ATPase subunit g